MKRIETNEKRITDPILREGIGSLPERIKEAMGDESNRQFAKNIGVSESNLRTLLKGAIPKLDTLMAIASYTGVDFTYLTTGQTIVIEEPENHLHYSCEDFDEDFELIDGYHTEVSAGHGAIWDNEEVRRRLAFRTKWLKFRGLKAKDLRVVFAKGDSMEPTIHSSDSLLVDISATDIVGGAIYIIRVGDHLYAKRIEMRVDGGVDIISENKAYPTQTLTAAELEQLHIAGKVVWVGKDIT